MSEFRELINKKNRLAHRLELLGVAVMLDLDNSSVIVDELERIVRELPSVLTQLTDLREKGVTLHSM